MRTSNPVLNDRAFAPENWGGVMADLADSERSAASNTMTARGAAVKTAFLLGICVVFAAISYNLAAQRVAWVMPAGMIGALAGFVIALVIGFKPTTAPALAPVYAVLKGGFLGVISYLVARSAGPQGAVLVGQAIGITLAIAFALSALFSFGLLRIGGTLARIIMVGTLGVGLLYLAQFVLGMFGVQFFGVIHGAGPVGIGFSLIVIALASANLVLDFQFVEQGAEAGAPKYMEWYAGFGILVTLVWLYIEVLRLLSKLRR